MLYDISQYQEENVYLKRQTFPSVMSDNAPYLKTAFYFHRTQTMKSALLSHPVTIKMLIWMECLFALPGTILAHDHRKE